LVSFDENFKKFSRLYGKKCFFQANFTMTKIESKIIIKNVKKFLIFKNFSYNLNIFRIASS
jgi:hypothetical protein